MRRIGLVVIAAAALGGCASFSDSFKSAPTPVTVQLESVPPGADAVTSIGPGCKTPCSLEVPAENAFTVTFTAPKSQAVTVPVTVTRVPGDFTTPASTVVEPNPIMAELPPLKPAKRKARNGVKKRAASTPPAATAPAAAAPAAGSVFPTPR
jgi:hypothetical protein